MPERPRRTLYLHVRTVDGSLFELGVAGDGNACALLQLGRQIDRALSDPDPAYPFDEAVYYDVYGQPFEVAVKRARSPEEMRESVPMKRRRRGCRGQRWRGGPRSGRGAGSGTFSPVAGRVAARVDLGRRRRTRGKGCSHKRVTRPAGPTSRSGT